MTVLASIMAAALAASQHPAVITNPDWLIKPSGEDFEAYYPKLMLALQIEGQADIRCDVTVEGDPANCASLFESPRGVGFGAAAVAMTPKMKFVPKKIDGVPVGGGTFRTTIRFHLEEASPGPIASVMPPSGTDAKTRALALRLAALLVRPLLEKTAPDKIAKVEAEASAGGEAVNRQRMVSAYLAAFKAVEPQIEQLHANLSLRLLTPAQFEAIVAFLETPSAQILLARIGQEDRPFTPEQQAEITTFMDSDAGRALTASSAQVFPKLMAELEGQGPALAVATLKTYCAEPGACPTRGSLTSLPGD